MDTLDLTGDDESPPSGYATDLAREDVIDLSAFADGVVNNDNGNNTELEFSEDEDDDVDNFAGATSGGSVRCDAIKDREVHKNGVEDLSAEVRKRKRADASTQSLDDPAPIERIKSSPLVSTTAAASVGASGGPIRNAQNANHNSAGSPNPSKAAACAQTKKTATQDSTLSAGERQAQMRQKFRDAKAREAASSADIVARFAGVPASASKALKVSSIATGPCKRTSLDPAMAALAAARRRRGWNDTLSTIERRRRGEHDKAPAVAATAAPAAPAAPAKALPPRASQRTHDDNGNRRRSVQRDSAAAAAVARTAPAEAPAEAPPLPRVTPETSFVDSSDDDDDDILEIRDAWQPDFVTRGQRCNSPMVDAAMAVLDVVFAGGSSSSSSRNGNSGSRSNATCGNIDGSGNSSASVHQSFGKETLDLSADDDAASADQEPNQNPPTTGTAQRKCNPKFPSSKRSAASVASSSSSPTSYSFSSSVPQSSSSSSSPSIPPSSSSASSSSHSSSSSTSTAPRPTHPSSRPSDTKPKPARASRAQGTKPKCKTCTATGDSKHRSLCDACLRCNSHCSCGAGGKPNCGCNLCEKRLYLYLKRNQMRSYTRLEKAELERQRGIEQDKLLREAKERFMQQAANPADPFGSSSCAQGQPRYTPEFRGNGGRFNNGSHNRGNGGGGHYSHNRSSQAHYTSSSSSSSSSSSAHSSGSPHWMSADPFFCLKLTNRNAPLAEVKAQYRRLCLLYHPDKSTHPQATEAFIAISTAYRMLSNQT